MAGTMYTIGNWDVNETISTSGTAHNFTALKKFDAANYALAGESATEATYRNVTGSNALCHQTVRFAVRPVQDMYKDTGIDPSMKDVTKAGTQMMVEIRGDKAAVNTVSGVEVLVPYYARLVIGMSKGQMVTDDFTKAVIAEVLSAANEASTDTATLSKFNELIRGAVLA